MNEKANRKIISFTILVTAVFFLNVSTAAETKKTSGHDIIVGATAGYSMFEGYYRSRFNGSYIVGTSLMYGNPGIVEYLAGQVEVAYARYPMRESRRSYLESVSINIGPVIYYPLSPNFQIYTGASARGSYLHLYASRTSHNVKSLKPGFLARAGFIFPIQWGLSVRLGTEYTFEYLSGKPLHGLNFTGGLSYNFNPGERAGEAVSIGDNAAMIEWYLTLAEKALAAGGIDEAKENYNKALTLDRNNYQARDQLAGITKAEGDYGRAMKMIDEKRYYDAMPLLDSAGKYLAPARAELEKIRGILAAEVKYLERNGIELYEKGDYRGCIIVLKRLLLIDPKNRTGLIYMPRAVKRQEALERLR
ncbi:MAG: hypothetical protein A2176_11050 [Spirochaetes bacterium RBG_13_51_14]|nr:MAG: hypothetical protein A2176_11050 [Spirochaetes bacterium RBG_13_51_14]